MQVLPLFITFSYLTKLNINFHNYIYNWYTSQYFITEINECLEGLHNCSNETELCINTFGSFECQCIRGYIEENKMCNGMYK